MLDSIELSVEAAAIELCAKANLKAGQVVIVGCSTSEIMGHNVGTVSNPEIGMAVFAALRRVFSERSIFLAAQCCEHLNRAVVIEREALTSERVVNAVPLPKAGGSFATAAYSGLTDPVLVEGVEADAGLDFGGTLIGMHLKRVAIPLRLDANLVGRASVIAARTRPPLIGGLRAVYDERLL